MATKSPTQVKQLKNISNKKKPKVETNKQKLGKRQGYLYNVGKSITYAAMEKMKTMNPVISDFSDTNNELFKTIYKSAIDYRTTYKRGLDAIMKSKFYDAANIGLTALKEDIMTGNLYNKERVEKLQMREMGLGNLDSGGFDDSFAADLDDLNLDDWGDDFADFDDDDWGEEDSSSESFSDDKTAIENLATINSIEGSSKANANAISMAVARSAEYTSNVNIKNTNLLYTQNTRAFGIMNGHLDAMNSNVGSVLQYLDKNMTPHLSNSTEFFKDTSKALQDQVALLREIAENTRKIEATTNDSEGNKKKAGYNDIVDGGGMPDLIEYGKKIMKNSGSYLNELTGGSWNMMMQGTGGENSNMLALFAANPYGALLSSMINRMTPKDLEKAFSEMNKTIGGFFGSMITKLNTMSNSEDSMLDKLIGKVFGIRNTAKSSIDVSKYDKGKVDWNGKSQKALTEVIPQQLSKILSALTGTQETTFNYETGKFITYDDMKKEYENIRNSFWKNAASEPMQEIRTIANNNLAFGSKEEYDKFFKDLERLFETTYSKGEIIDFQRKDFREKYIDYGVDEKNLLAIQSILRELPRNIMMQYNADMQDQYVNQTKRFTDLEKSGQYSYLFNNSNHNEFAKKIDGKENKKTEKTKFNTNLLLDTKDNFGRNIFFYMQSMYKELNYMRQLTAQGFGGGGSTRIPGMPLDLIQKYQIVDSNGNIYYQNHDRSFYNISKNAIKDDRSENEKMSDSAKKALERDKENKSFLRQQEKRLEKGEILVNISDIDVDNVRGAVRTNVQTNKNKQMLNEEKEKDKTDFDKLKEEMGISGKSFGSKFDKFAEKAQKYIKRPSSVMTDIAVKVDQGLFELIYGKEGQDGKKSIKGILDHLIFEMKKSFSRFNEFLDEKILNPLKERLGIDKDTGLIKGIYKKVSEYFGLNEKKEGVKNFFKQVGNTMKESVKSIGSSIFGSVKDVFSPLTDKFKSKNFFDKKKSENKEEEDFDNDTISNEVTKILRNYNFDNYNNLNYRERYNLTRQGIEHAKKVKSGKSNNMYEIYDMNNIKLELKELEEQTKNLKDIKDYSKLPDTIKALERQLPLVEDYLNDLKVEYAKIPKDEKNSQKAKKFKEEIVKCLKRIDRIKDTIEKSKKRLEEIKNNNKNIEEDVKSYNQAKRDIIDKNNFKKYDIDQKQKVLNEQAYEYFQSNEYKNLSVEDRRRIAEEMLGGDTKNIIDQLKKSQDRLEELKNQNGTEIGRYKNYKGVKTERTKYGRKNVVRKINTSKLQDIEKKKIKDLTNQFNEVIKVDDMSLPTLRYLASLDDKYQGLLSEITANGESEELNKEIEKIEKSIEEVEGNLNSNNIRTLAGLNLEFDKSAKQKLIDSFKGTFGEDNIDMENVLSKTIDKLFEGRDSNYKENFENVTVAEILSQRDSVLKDLNDRKEKNIQSRNKITKNKMKFDPKYVMSKNAPVNKRIASLEKEIEQVEVIFDEFTKSIVESLGITEDGKTSIYDHRTEDVEIIDAFERIKKQNEANKSEENLQDKDRPWSDNLSSEEGSSFITDRKFITESMKEQTTTAESMDNTLKNILNILQTLSGYDVNQNVFSLAKNNMLPVVNPLRNVTAENEQLVLRNFINGLTTDITRTTESYFGRVGIPGFAKGGVIDKDQLAVVGKGETVIPALEYDKHNQIVQQVRDSIGKIQSGKWKDNKIHDQAKYLYQNISAIMGAENIDPNILISLISKSGDAGNDFANMENQDQQKHFVKVAKITQQALSQRNEGVITNSGAQTEKGQKGEYAEIFSETFKIYENAISKIMKAVVGDNDEKKEKKTSVNIMKEVMSEAKLYAPDVVAGALLGGGASLLTGFIGGPLLAAAVGSGIALIKNSTKIQSMLFGEKEFDKDGNYVGRRGGLLPKDLVNKAAKVFPDMKKYGIVGALSGFTFLNPFGPVPGLLIGSALGVAKNNATIQSRLFGESGIIGEEKWNKFKKNLPHMLAGAGVGFGLNMLNLSGPFGVLGSILIGSALGYASTTDKFKEMIFGTYNPKTDKQEGGIIGFFKEKIAEPFINWAKRDILKPLKDAFDGIPRQIGIMFKTVFGGLAKKVVNFFTRTLVVPIREKVGGFLNTVFSPFKNLGKRLLGTAGRIISAPARLLGGIGRASKRHQIKTGTADNMTAEERLDYMNEQNEMNFFYKQSQKMKNESYDNVAKEMEQRFGKKQAKTIKFLMKTGYHDQAQKYIKKQFGDVRDEDSKIVMENMLKNADNYKKLFGSRILRDTYYERKGVSDDVRNQVETQYEEFMKANPDSKVTREEFIKSIYGDSYNDKVLQNGYNNDEADKLLASMTNKELETLVNEYKAFGVSDKQYDKNKKQAGKEITKLLKNMNIGVDGKLSRKDRSEILGGLNYGRSDLAIKYLKNLAEQQGVKIEDSDEFNKIVDLMKEFQITEELRLDKERGKSSYDKKINELVGNSTFLGKEMTFDTFAKLAMSENKLRNSKGKVVDNKKLRDDETNKKITEIIKGIGELNKDLTDKQNQTNKLLEDIRDFKTGDKSFQKAREEKKIRLDNAVFKDEQELSTEQKKRLVLLRRLNIKSLDEQPDFIRNMSLKELTAHVKKFRTVSNKELLEQYKQENEDKKKVEEEKKKAEEEEAKKQKEENKNNQNDVVQKIKDNAEKNKKGLSDEQKQSILDEEGNEVVMKRDSKTGQFEADTTDSSTRKSIKIGQRLREKQESFYDTFSNLFKKNEKEDEEEKKSGGWLSKVLMALGLGKSLLGRVKGLLGGILGRGMIGSLFTRGIFGSLGKGALVIGGLMYLPEIIDLFKTKIGPTISENWDNTIKPWLTEEALPRIKDGLLVLVQEIPSLLKGTIKFIGSELIPSLLKGIGWDIGDKDSITYDEDGNPVSGVGTTTTGAVVANTAIRSSVRKGAKYADAVKKSVSKNVVEEGATKTFAKSLNKTGVEEITEGAIKSGFKGNFKDIAKTGLKTAKDFALHPIKTSVKGTVKGAKSMTNVSGKVLGNVFLKSDAKRMVKNGSTFTKKAEGKILSNVVDNTLSGRLINFCKEQFTKLFTNKTVVNLLGSVKKIPIAKTLLEKFVPKILEVASKNVGKLAGTALARAVGGISTGGIVTAGFAIYDFVSGFKDARNILGITESDIPFGYRIAAAVVKAVQGLSIIATLIPTKTIMSVLISVLEAAGVDMGNIKEQQEKAEKEVQEYNEQNGTNYSLEEYNKEVKGYKGIFSTIGGGIKSVGSKALSAGGKLLNGAKSVGGKLLNGAKWVNDNGFDWAADKIASFGKTAVGAGKWAIGKYNDINKGVYELTLGWLKDGFSKAKDELSEWYQNDVKPMFKSIGDTFNNIKDWCKRLIEDPVKTIGEGFQSLLDWFKDKFSWVFDAGSWASDKWNDIKNGVKNIFTQEPSTNLNTNVSNIKTVNGMTVGQGEGDVVNGNPYFSQKQAKGQLGQMISDAGCGPTSTAMALSKVTGKNISPESIASDAYKNKTWDSEGARGSMFASEAKKYGVKTISSGGDFAKFDKMVSAGIPTAVSGTLGKGEDSPYTKAGHIVTVFGKDKNGNYLVNDPRGKKYSKAYSKEELMNGFKDSWSFGKGDEDSIPSTDSVINNAKSSMKSVSASELSGAFRKKSTSTLNYISKSINNTGLIESASRVLQEIFTKIFNDDIITNLLGDATDSEYSASSVLLANFVPQVIKKLKSNCEKNKSNNLNKYLRAIISNSNISNISFLISNFISTFNNPSKYIGKYETYTTGMKTCAAIMSIINERFVIDKILPSSDWATLIEKYVMPIFGEGKQDVENIKKQAEKIIKEFDLKSMSTNAQTDTLNNIANITGTTSSSSIFSKITDGAKNIASTVSSGVKSVVSKAGNAVNNLFNNVKGAASTAVSFISGLFGKGEYVGRGKEIASNSQERNSIVGLNNFPYFSQYKSYSNIDTPELSESGCGPTSAAMVLSKITGKTVLPDEVASESYNVGLYDNNGSIDTMFPYIGKKYGINVKSLDSFDQIRQYANRGIPMVISGEGGNLYGKQADGHIVAMFGKTKNGYIVNDPSSVENSKTYNENQLKQGFKHAWVFGDVGYKNDIKEAEQVMGINSKINNSDVYQDPNFVGKGEDPTTLTYVNGFPYWSQVAFGGNIMKAGCGPTSAAMAFGLVTGKTLSPKDMCEDGKKYGWSPSSGVTNSSKLFNHYAKKYNVDIELINSLSKTKQLAAKGYPMIVDGRKSKSSNWAKNCLLTPYGPNGHYQALFGKTDDGYVMNDPRGSKYSGARSEAQLSDGFNFAYKIGDKTYSVDPTKVKKIGDSGGAESSGSSTTSDDTSTETSSSSSDFFGDMATAALNFSKKLFGFDLEDTSSSNTSTSANSMSGSEDPNYTGTDYKAGQSVKASFTAYYPKNNSMEGGYYDCVGNLLKPENQTCAAPKDVPVGTKIKISNTGTALDGKIYTVTDRGGAIKIVNGVYRIDILVSETNYSKFQNCSGNITFMGKDGSNVGKGPAIDDIFNQYYGKGENIDWGYFCDPSLGTISSYFGEKRSKYANAQGNHGALDYNIHFQSLYAPKSGTVYTENEHSSYGNSLTIKTNTPNVYYRLAHMKKKAVSKGDTIKQGQYLGVSGDTGHVTGPHVHFEILKGGVSKKNNGVDPLNYYTETSGGRIKLKGSSLSFKDYMDKIGSDITEVNGDSDSSSYESSSDTSTETSSSSSDFFGDMATAALNFSKKLFGFDLEDTSSTTTTDSSSEEYNSSSSDESNISAQSVAQKVLNFTKSKGASDAASAGVLGNAWCETRFRPTENDKTTFGLFQWLHKYGQFEALQKIAKSMNLKWTDTDAQLAYMWSQLSDSTHKVWLKQQYGDKGIDGFLAETDAYTAGYKFNKFFERGLGGETRGKTAATIYKKYLKNGKLTNFDNFISTGKGDDETYGKGDDKVTLASKLIEYALSFLNKGFYYSQPKREYIDNNKNASDCSSFTHHVFDRAAGKEIGAYSEEQYLSKNGTKVTKDKLQPGDIILFKNTASSRNGTTNYKDNVSHSSIYLGDNKYIESTKSSSSGFSGIRVASLDTNWSKNHWLTGKRFIDGDKKVSPSISNPNKLTKFEKATGSYTLPDVGTSSSGSSSSDTTSSSASDFFGDMATAALNFSKKLFGFDLEDTSSTTTDITTTEDSDLSSSTDYSSVTSKVSTDDFNKSVYLGDSIAVGFKDLGGIPSNRVVATSGDTVKKGINNGNLDKAIAKKPAVLITHYGTNDAGWIGDSQSSLTTDWFKNNYKTLINKVKKGSPKTKIVLTQAFTPTSGNYKKWVPAVQKVLPSIASENSVSLVDSRSIDKASYKSSSDPIHPISQEFYKNWINDIKGKITTSGKGEDYIDATSDITNDIDKYFEDTLDGVKSSDFGLRDNEFHTGVDYAARENTPIKSPVSGKVVENTNDNKFGFGNTVVVRDRKGIDHRFAHMRDKSSYGLGTKIRKGDEIGNVGSTGRSTGSHLHYEVSDKGKSLNPTKYFDKSAHGGTNNSLDKVTLSFPESDQKIDANISTNTTNNGIDEKMLKQLITIIISVLNKVANNTESISEVVDLLTDIQKSITGNTSITQSQQANKLTSSDSNKTKTQKIFSLLQKGVNNTDNDTTNTQAILDILEVLAKE